MKLAKFLTKFNRLFKCAGYQTCNTKIYVANRVGQQKPVDNLETISLSTSKVISWSYVTGELTIWVKD